MATGTTMTMAREPGCDDMTPAEEAADRARRGKSKSKQSAEKFEEAVDLGAVERVMAAGDLANLTKDDRFEFYVARCKSAGLDPVTQPFNYLLLDGKLVLYANKGCTDQLTANRRLTVRLVHREYLPEVCLYEATVRVTFGETGQEVDDIGVVSMLDKYGKPLAGDKQANAVMKAVTKAKRRAILSACGLGMLDESEIETIQGARRVAADYVPSPSIETQARQLPAPMSYADVPDGPSLSYGPAEHDADGGQLVTPPAVDDDVDQDPPGAVLYAWAVKRGIVDSLNAYGSRQAWPPFMEDWDAKMCKDATDAFRLKVWGH